MSIPDDLMKEWFTLLTDRPTTEIDALADPVQTHPMAAKKTLARDIVTFYYGTDAATAAQANWEKRFSDKKDPDNIPEVTVPAGEIGLLQLLVKVGFCKSNNEARNKVNEGAVTIGPERTKITDWKATVKVEDGLVVRLGSKKIARLRVG
jgi:tyrosyl-tRNA synthetase